MKRIGILIGWLVWAAGVSAQSWSLDDCMKYAVEHATEVKREVVNARQRKQDYQHAVAGFLPTVTGGVQDSTPGDETSTRKPILIIM